MGQMIGRRTVWERWGSVDIRSIKDRKGNEAEEKDTPGLEHIEGERETTRRWSPWGTITSTCTKSYQSHFHTLL